MTPFMCPVCMGRTTVPSTMYEPRTGYSGTVAEELKKVPCRSCSGTGVVWGPNSPWTLGPVNTSVIAPKDPT